MSNLIRWEPAREMMSLRDAMDRLFDDAFTRPLSIRDGWSVPAIDMFQTDDEIVVKAALPGIKAEEVQINVTGEVLTLKGEVKQNQEMEEKAWHIREQRFGSFERSIRIPSTVDEERIEAHLKDGVLEVRLPKSKPAESSQRKIRIEAP